MLRDEKLLQYVSRVQSASPKCKKLISGQAYRYLDRLLNTGLLDIETHSSLVNEFNELAYKKEV